MIQVTGRFCAAVVVLALSACGGPNDPQSPPQTSNYTIGGSVAGLAGTGLVLRNNGGNDLAISQNGAFTFTNSQPTGTLYNVTVASQPSNPSQTCSVARSVDGITGGNVTNISVTCTTNSYSISGTVTGLVGSGLVLQNNGGNSIAVPQNSAFTFSASILSGGTYSVTVGTQPSQPKQTCNVANGSGTVTNNNVVNVAIICTTNAYLVGGLVTGLAGDGLVLQNNGGNDLPILADGPFSFLIPLLSGDSYAVTTSKQPINVSQTCTVLNGAGTIGVATVNTIAVSCVTNKFNVGGTVIGLAPGTNVVLQNNGGDTLTVSSNGAATFSKTLLSGATYDVRVVRQPANPNQVCQVTNGAGTVTNFAVTAPTIDCVTQHPRFAFSLDYNNQSLSTYAIDETTGLLRRRGYSNVGLRPIQTARDATQKFLFVLNRGSATVSAFAHDSVTGENAEVSGSPYPTGAVANSATGGDGANGLATHPTKEFLYVANGSGTGANNLAGFTVDATSGALTPIPGSPFPTGSRPFALSIDAQGKFLYSLNTGSNNIYVYTIDQSTGALTEVQNSRAATGTLGASGLFVLHPNGRFGFVGNAGSNDISVYSVNTATGVLTNVPGSPFAAGISPGTGIWLHPNGHFLYVRNSGTTDVNNGSVSAYAFDEATGFLTEVSGSPFATGINSLYSWMDPARRFLYIVNRGPTSPTGPTSQGSISIFKLDNSTGALISAPGSPLSVMPAPFTLNIDPSGRFAYASSVQGNFVYSFSVDQSTGALTPLTQGARIATRSQPITLDPQAEKLTPQSPVYSSKFAFVANSAAGSLSSFVLDGATGALSSATSLPSAGPSPNGTAVHPNGKNLYVSDADPTRGISSYSIGPTTGVLSGGTNSLNTADGLNIVRIDPNGRTVYANAPSPTAAPMAFQRAYSIAPTTGLLSFLSGTSTSDSQATATDIAIAPTGSYLYFVTDSTIGFAPLAQASGEFVTPPTISSGVGGKSAVAIDPSYRFAYVALATTPGGVEVRTINPYTGALSGVVQTATTGSNPKALTVDPTGRFLYVANSGSDDVSTFAIDQTIGPTAGQLTEVLPRVAAGTNPTAISADYGGKYVYVLSGAPNQVLQYSINQLTGALGAILSSAATGNGPGGLSLSTNIQ